MSAVKKLELKHEEHVKWYDPKGGEDNKRRLTGQHETSSISNFSYGVGDRGASIRVSQQVGEENDGKIKFTFYFICTKMFYQLFIAKIFKK